MRQVEKEALIRELPQRMPEEMLRWAKRELRSELGGEFLIWKAARVRGETELCWIMDNDLREGKSVWAAEVTCSCCHETFYTMGGKQSFFLAIGPDGCSYNVDPRTNECDAEEDIQYVELGENDGGNCPYCGMEATAIHASRVRGGRTKRIMLTSLGRIREYGVIYYWMAEKKIDEYGTWYTGTPIAAYVIGKNREIVKYARYRPGVCGGCMRYMWGEWSICRNASDVGNQIYSDWGSINNRKKGAVCYREIGTMVGTTVERTGLYAMASWGENDLLGYLAFWKAHSGVENLAVQGFQKIVSEMVHRSITGGFRLEKRKPNEILGMRKEDYRKAAADGRIRNWDGYQWREYHGFMGKNPELVWEDFVEMQKFFGNRILVPGELGEKPKKVKGYMEKQGLNGNQVQLLVDVRRMGRTIYNRALTNEELWPRDLRMFHDQLMEMQLATQKEADRRLYESGFREVKEAYGNLEWNDGELAIFLPMSNGELIREGEVLRHCVGGYGKAHIEGTDVIWFVRHYRRPERSYYTLDINMKTGKEVQLHGYGNEHHGKNKEHKHTIPKKVRDFCDRWEEEILRPYIEKREREKRSA